MDKETKKQMKGGYGGMLSFIIKGGEIAALEFVKHCSVFMRATSLGGVESLIEHRYSIEGESSPIPKDLVRISVGIEAPDDLIPQFEYIRKSVEAFNLPSIELINYEADDLIATYAKKITDAGAKVTIISSDKDLMQLVSDKIRLFDPMKSRVIGEKEVIEKFGVKPNQVIDVQSLAGDSSDNVPGVPGIGVKTAAELINKYKNLENLLNKASEIPQNKRREALLSNKDKASPYLLSMTGSLSLHLV